jgi:hypothetical protein
MDPNTQTPPDAAPTQPPAEQPDYSKPVGYDTQGQPLYAHPPQPQAQAQPQPDEPSRQTVYMSRPIAPARPELTADIKALADESRKKYPRLNLSEGEYVITAVKRHPIGLIQIWGGLGVVALLLLGLFAFLVSGQDSALTSLTSNTDQIKVVGGALLGGFIVLLGFGGLAATYIYKGNRFYLTSESVIEDVQTSLFAKYEQTISLANIEDASFRQDNPLQMLLNYGSIRLSTQGDEDTYRFTYVAAPKKCIATLNNAVESFKNYRPVE